MANIIISDLDNADEKKFIFNLNNLDKASIFGGGYNDVNQILNYD